MAETRALVLFKERSYQALYEDFRIFIQGVDVTGWVSGSVTITRSNRDGPGTCTFTLDNAMDRFVLTAENLAQTAENPSGKWRDTMDRYSEAAKHAIYLYKTGQAKVTQDRIAELTNVLFDRNREIVRTRTELEVARDTNESRRRRNMRNLQRDTGELASINVAELRVTATDTVQDMPADTVLDDPDGVKAAVFEQLAARGLPQKDATDMADDIVERRKRQLVDAGRQRPAGDGPAVETNEDQASAERKGRHRRQKLIRNPIDSDTGDARWPLQERSVIFHKNDPVRVFIHNPLTEDDDFWLYGFTGFISEYPVQTDYLTSQSTIQIQCYDLKALMQKMRVQQNTVIEPAPEPLFLDRSSVFADLIQPTRWGHAFAHESFPEAMSILMTGTKLDRRGQSKRFGVADFALGKTVTYPVTENPDDDVNRTTLEEWHTLCLNGPASLTDEDRIANTTPLTKRMVEQIGRGTTTDGEYQPTRGFVHFLLPKDGTAARQLTSKTFDAGSEQREFISRYEIVAEFCGHLDYEFVILPNGDAVFEFPMYDFMPEDFGDYKGCFEMDYHLMSGQFADETGDVISALIVSGGPANTEADAYGNAPAKLIPRGLIQSSIIASRVGVTVENVSLPFVREAGRLRSYGMIEFQKRLANANTIDMQFGFRPFMMPNRPVYNVHEKRMGLTSSITDTMELFGTCSTGAAIRFVRQVRADGTFRFITGGDSMPISYRNIFPGNVKSVGNATVGVRTTLEQDGADSAVDNQKVEEETGVSTNDDRPPGFIQEARPGLYFTLTPNTRRVVDQLGVTFRDRPFLLNHTPEADGTAFAVRAREPDGKRVYSDTERTTLALAAKQTDYILIDTRERFRFEPRRSGQPTFIVRPENA